MGVNGVTVRTTSDVQTIRKLLWQFEDMFPNLRERVQDYEEYAKKLAENAQVYLIGEEVRGFAAVYANDVAQGTAYIPLIGVLPHCRGEGLGKKLMELCCSEARRLGMKSIRLEVRTDNHTAMEFFTRCGFSKSGTCSAVSILMEKSLVSRKDSMS